MIFFWNFVKKILNNSVKKSIISIKMYKILVKIIFFSSSSPYLNIVPKTYKVTFNILVTFYSRQDFGTDSWDDSLPFMVPKMVPKTIPLLKKGTFSWPFFSEKVSLKQPFWKVFL